MFKFAYTWSTPSRGAPHGTSKADYPGPWTGTYRIEHSGRRASCASPHQSVREAVRVMLANSLSCLPVVDTEQRIVGLLDERDAMQALMRAVVEHAPGALVSDVMHAPKIIDEHVHIMTIAHYFLTTAFDHLAVVDSQHRLLGLVDRRQLLTVCRDIFDQAPDRRTAILYLSATGHEANQLR